MTAPQPPAKALDKLRPIRIAQGGLRSIGATAVGLADNIWRFRAAERARVVLICPRCGHETSEYVDTLHGTATYHCRGDGCAYSFDIVARIGSDSTTASE